MTRRKCLITNQPRKKMKNLSKRNSSGLILSDQLEKEMNDDDSTNSYKMRVFN